MKSINNTEKREETSALLQNLIQKELDGQTYTTTKEITIKIN